MGIHDLGYRKWDGVLASPWTRWTVLARAGIRRAWQSKWLKRMMLFAWLPAVWFSVGFFVWEHSLSVPEMRNDLRPFLPESEALRGLAESFQVQDEVVARHSVWSWLLYTFLRYPQSVIMVLMVGIVAPPLVSQDVRSRAFLLYFSRPLAQWQYALGKLAPVWFYLLAISAAPALLMYVLGALLSPSLQVVSQTWDLPLRILAASAVLMIPTAALALCMSSLTQESRYAAFAWFAAWVLGWVTYATVVGFELEGVVRNGTQETARQIFTKWAPVSFYHALGQVQSWIFGFAPFEEARMSWWVLIVITIISTMILFRRISAPLRA